MRILLIEDEAELAAELRSSLERERFLVDHADCIDVARETPWDGVHDLVLLGRTLPDGDGLSLIPSIRANNPGVPIIILSAHGELGDRVAGLNEGADDYLVKPFALEEMFARIRAVRRRPGEITPEKIHVGELTFDPVNGEAVVAGQQLPLTRRELHVLETLMRRCGRTVLREALKQAVYGFDDEIRSNALDAHVSRLRRKLADAETGVEIHAIRGVGYLLRPKP